MINQTDDSQGITSSWPKQALLVQTSLDQVQARSFRGILIDNRCHVLIHDPKEWGIGLLCCCNVVICRDKFVIMTKECENHKFRRFVGSESRSFDGAIEVLQGPGFAK